MGSVIGKELPMTNENSKVRQILKSIDLKDVYSALMLAKQLANSQAPDLNPLPEHITNIEDYTYLKTQAIQHLIDQKFAVAVLYLEAMLKIILKNNITKSEVTKRSSFFQKLMNYLVIFFKWLEKKLKINFKCGRAE